MAKIFVVDDSSFARNNLRRVLEGAGHEVFQNDSGEAAVNLVKTVTPDLVTLDLLMPGMSGKEALIEMKKICPQAKYVIITADIQETTRRELLSLGADDFLNKPFQAANLLETVNRLLEESKTP